MSKALAGLTQKIFILSLVFLLSPPFSLPVFNTVYLGRFLLYLCLFLVVVMVATSKKRIFPKLDSYLLAIILFFFFQSVSVVMAVDRGAFLLGYEKVVAGIFAFIVSSVLVKVRHEETRDKIIKTLFWLAIIRLGAELVLFLFPDLFLSTVGKLLDRDIASSISANLLRGRTYIELLQEASIPFIFYMIYLKGTKIWEQTLAYFLIILNIFIAFLSNWRGRFIVSLVAVPLSFSLFTKTARKSMLPLIIFGSISLFGLYGLDKSQVFSSGFSVIDRLENRELNDLDSVKWRVRMMGTSFELGFTHPLGVGLKNFSQYVTSGTSNPFAPKESVQLGREAVFDGPHNIFPQFMAETGIAGLLAFGLMLIIFARHDSKLLRGKPSNSQKALIAFFWLILTSTLFYPASSLSFYVYFFLARGLLYEVT